MRHSDTVDKILQTYLGGLCRQPFVFKGKEYTPKPVTVSPLLLRGFTCPENCGACCGSFSLDYLPSERATDDARPRVVSVNREEISIVSDQQKDVSGRWCRNLDKRSGRCLVYEYRPFSCDFELIRLLIYDNRVVLTQKLYGRFWAMERLDGSRGALCDMTPPDTYTVNEVRRKLRRLKDWAKHFNVVTCVDEIINWVESKDNVQPLHLEP